MDATDRRREPCGATRQFTHEQNGNNPTGYNPIFRETGHPLLLLPVLLFHCLAEVVYKLADQPAHLLLLFMVFFRNMDLMA